MYKKRYYPKTLLKSAPAAEGESIETKVSRLLTSKEPIKDGAPLIFTDKKEGVNAAYNIRTDRWEIATDAMTKILKSKEAKRDELIKKMDEAKKDKEAPVINLKDGKPESTAGKVNEG